MAGPGFDPLLVSELTRDPIAERDSICQRTSCQATVPKGQPYIYVGTKDGKTGRHVCARCYQRYQRRPDAITITRDAHGPDINAIQRSVSAAHSRNSINPPAVVSINQGLAGASRGMPPPPPPSGRRPDIRVPSVTWETPDDQSVALRNSGAAGSQNVLGYNPNHKMYAAENNYWANRSYGIPPPVDTITLSITALYETGKRGRQRGTQFGNICEGVKDVDARLTAPKLRVLALATLVPSIQAFCPQFTWRTNEFIVRDDAWVDLAKYPDPRRPYFYDSCLHNSRKGSKGSNFRTKICALNVIVPQAQWLEYEAFKDELERNDSEVHKPAASFSFRARTPSPGPSNRQRSASPRPSFYSPRAPPIPGPSKSNHPRGPVSHGSPEPSLSFSPLPTSPLPSNLLFLTGRSDHPPRTNDVSHTSNPPSKHVYPHSASISGITTKPLSVKRPIPTHDTPSPSQKDIKDALKSGGAASLNVDLILKQTTHLINFHPIPTLPFTEILKPEHRSFNIDVLAPYPGQLRVDRDTKRLIGVGGFKTTQAAQLVLSSPPTFGLGSRQSGQNVVAKRPYNRRENPEGKPPFPRYMIADELDKLFCEANVLYWAKALLSMTYTFIDRALAATNSPPNFDIPRLRFVEAGLAFCYDPSGSSVGGPRLVSRKAGSGASVAYLVEELIPDPESFTKFIHNGTCLPLVEPDEPGYDVAEFLAFTQHVQYLKTSGLAYISDYQGNTSLLTDPQILTHPSVGEGTSIFSEGNLEKGVAQFEKEHVCNKYCKWPGFNLVIFQSGVEKTTADASQV